jgi:hypothetical protein
MKFRTLFDYLAVDFPSVTNDDNGNALQHRQVNTLDYIDLLVYRTNFTREGELDYNL